MCGRLSLFAPPGLLAERFDADPVRELDPRYNVAPGQDHPVVRNDDPESIRFPTWGLVPTWADGPSSSGHVNARAETLTEKPSFREAFAERRCLVLADGFYDWKGTPTGKQPYRVEREDREPFALAGLWEPAPGADDGDEGSANETDGAGATFTVVTTEPNAVAEPVHHRMPVVLDPEGERRWLREDDPEALTDLLGPSPTPEMHAYPVPSALGDPANDSPDLVEEVPAEEDVQTGLDEF
ncbi:MULTISPECIES: SOS response-associated peptidase [Halorussus]|uniref:SOS response-associated peptidase n=1 Tax=Halorussus TaxID=1070314 RepID=UPI000E210B71|nr:MULTISPECIES: SOS response-associated peptidase [Halorussus]NHN60795.1 SOS response-associated peptidase [Halorussus sp. JP-T4]